MSCTYIVDADDRGSLLDGQGMCCRGGHVTLLSLLLLTDLHHTSNSQSSKSETVAVLKSIMNMATLTVPRKRFLLVPTRRGRRRVRAEKRSRP